MNKNVISAKEQKQSGTENFRQTLIDLFTNYHHQMMSERIKEGIRKAKLEGKQVFATKKQN